MAEKKTRVRMLRTVQGETKTNDELDILTKGSVVDVSDSFGAELVASKAAEEIQGKEELLVVPLHPPEVKADKAAK